MFSLSFAALLSLSSSAIALSALHPRDATKLTPEQLASYAPYTQFARAAYCPSSKIDPWACGSTPLSDQFTTSTLLTKSFTEACDANADFQPKFTGGDGDDVQFCRFTLHKP